MLATLCISLGWLLPVTGCLTYFADVGQAQTLTPTQSATTAGGGEPISPNAATATDPLRLSQAEEAQLRMKWALITGVWGPPAHCQISQEITILGRTLHGTGEYSRGSLGQMKMNLKIVAGDHLNIVHQVSDGRMLHTLKNIDGIMEGCRVDLGRVWKYLGRYDQEKDKHDPLVALHLAIGGQNEKLRALYQQYSWIAVQPGSLVQPGDTNRIDVWWLRGERNLGPPTSHGLTEMDGLLATADAVGLAPDIAKIALGRSSPHQYWLYHVEEVRLPKSDGSAAGFGLVSKIDYYQPKVISEWPENSFDASTIDLGVVERIIDETRKYLPPARLPDTQTASRQ